MLHMLNATEHDMVSEVGFEPTPPYVTEHDTYHTLDTTSLNRFIFSIFLLLTAE